LLFKTIPITV